MYSTETLTAMTVVSLRKIAADLPGVTLTSKARKPEIVAAILEATSASIPAGSVVTFGIPARTAGQRRRDRRRVHLGKSPRYALAA